MGRNSSLISDRFPIASLVAAVSVSLLASVAAFAAEPALTLKVQDQKAPSEVAEPIRALLQEKCVALSGVEGPVFEFWFVKNVALKSKPADTAQGLESLKEAALLGVVRVPKAIRDYRDDQVDPGVYTLRYAVQPNDGDHLGSAPTTHFALLIKASLDTAVDGLKDHDSVAKASQKDTAGKHPSSLNLQSVSRGEGDFPKLGEGEWNSKLLQVKLPGKVDDGSDAALVFGLVYQGKGHT